MKLVIFDTETTDLKPGYICQLAYLVLEDGKIIPKNYFFSVPYVSEGAEKVHGFSREYLEELSGGKVFADSVEEIREDFSGVDYFVAHNIEYDINFVRIEMLRATGKPLIIPREHRIDTADFYKNILKLPPTRGMMAYVVSKGTNMNYNVAKNKSVDELIDLMKKNKLRVSYKIPKLEEVAHYLDISPFMCKTFMESLYGVTSDAHDARFDIIWTWLLLERDEAIVEAYNISEALPDVFSSRTGEYFDRI